MTAYRTCRLGFLVLMPLAWAATAFAQPGYGKHMVNGFIGTQMYDRSSGFSSRGADFGVDANLGGRYQYNLTDRWAVEGSLLFSPGNTKLLEATFPTPPTSPLPPDDDEPDPLEDDETFGGIPGTASVRRSVGVNAWYYNANAVYSFSPVARITPFATAGLGGVSLDVDRGNTEQSLTFNFGGGALIPIKSRFATRIDVRDYVYTLDNLGARTRQTLNVPGNFSSTIHDVAINFGMTWTF